jgi:hypothetical protein
MTFKFNAQKTLLMDAEVMSYPCCKFVILSVIRLKY